MHSDKVSVKYSVNVVLEYGSELESLLFQMWTLTIVTWACLLLCVTCVLDYFRCAA